MAGIGFALHALPQGSRAGSLRRVGFLPGSEPSLIAAFSDELSRLGYVDRENILLETRISRPNTSDLAVHAAELAHMDLELIAMAALPAALEVRSNNQDIPMVIATCPGMISNGFAASLKHPGGNVTGMDELPPGLTAKRLTLLKTAAPDATRIALLSMTPGRGGHEAQLADAEEAATALGVTVKPYRVTSRNELAPALAAMLDDQVNGLATFQGALALFNRKVIIDFITAHRLPAVYQATLFAESGGLMTWAPDLEEQFRVAARAMSTKFLKAPSRETFQSNIQPGTI